MSLPLPAELNELSRIAQWVGCPDPVAYLRELSWVDVDLLRDVGQQVWGADGVRASAQATLERIADDLVEQLLTSVQDRWQGPAYQQFEHYMKVIQAALDDEAQRLQQVGSVLVEVADAFVVRWFEILGYVLAVVGLIVGAAGIIVAVVAGITGIAEVIGLILGVIGLIIGVAGLLAALVASFLPRLEAAEDAISRTAELSGATSQVDAMTSRGGSGLFPIEASWWTPRTPSPDN